MFVSSGFLVTKVPENLDAVIIGSGIGGLGLAVLLAKVGKKVLVLEQHDRAGGCCHTFREKGYEFDVGEFVGLFCDSWLNLRIFQTHWSLLGFTIRDPLHRGSVGSQALPLHAGPDDGRPAAVGASGESF